MTEYFVGEEYSFLFLWASDIWLLCAHLFYPRPFISCRRVFAAKLALTISCRDYLRVSEFSLNVDSVWPQLYANYTECV